MSTKSITVTMPFYYLGQAHDVGTVLEVDTIIAAELITTNRAEITIDPATVLGRAPDAIAAPAAPAADAVVSQDQNLPLEGI